MTDRHDDAITIALALLLAAAIAIGEALVAIGALVAQLLDAIAGNDRQPPGSGPGLPTALPVVITAPTTPAAPATANLAALTVPQLRQLLRGTGTPGWWSLNRQQCLAALAGGAC